MGLSSNHGSPRPSFSALFFFFKKILFILCLTARSLGCCTQAFSSCSEQGPLSSCSSWASHGGGLLLSQSTGSVVGHGFSCSVACGIFLDRGIHIGEADLCHPHPHAWLFHGAQSSLVLRKETFPWSWPPSPPVYTQW